MRKITVALAAVAAASAGFTSALAQDTEMSIARELERRSRAAEQDDGFCARVRPNLVPLTRPQAAEQLNRVLARPDRESASLVFVMSDLPQGAFACAYFAFRPAGQRDGKKCRAAEIFVCVAGQDCRAKLGESICEIRPGVWD